MINSILSVDLVLVEVEHQPKLQPSRGNNPVHFG